MSWRTSRVREGRGRATGLIRRPSRLAGLLATSVAVGVLAGVLPACAPPGGSQPVPATCKGLDPTIRADGSVVGTPGPDVIITGHGPDRVLSLGGDDVICTNGGDDIVDAGTESDWADGGAGFDTCGSAEAVVGCEDDLIVGPVIEEGVDLDRDGVDDQVEQRFGSSPSSSDTDGDGLTDLFESRWGGVPHRPDSADSDGDYHPDSVEDVDGDGLNALAEQAAGTSPLTADSDDDGLKDGRDEGIRGTDSLRADTDGDGLGDGAEVSNGTDPTLADTDGDGTGDGEESREVTASLSDAGVAASLSAPAGLLVDSVEVRSLASEPEITAPGIVGSAVEVDTGGLDQAAITTASITMGYPATVSASAAQNLKVLTWDDSIGGWAPPGPLDQQVLDTTNHTVTATVAHFSTFALVDVAALQAFWANANDLCQAGPGDPVATSLDLAVVIDTSGSMSSSDPAKRRVTESQRIIQALRPDDRATVIGFNSAATVRYALGSDKTAATTAASQLGVASGGTSIGAGVSAGLSQLSGEDPARSETMLVFTDGQGSYSDSITTAAVADGVKIYTVGLGSGVDQVLLERIANTTGAAYYPIASADDIYAVFQAILANSDDTRDSDSDGLTDCEEQRGMPNSRGWEYTSDPLVADTDGDGLDDGFEIGEKQWHPFGGASEDSYYYEVPSNPRKANTDGDPDHSDATKIDDLEEVAIGADPRKIDTDGDGLDDSTENSLDLDPASDDTDGDGFDDNEEWIDPDDRYLDPWKPDEKLETGEYLRLYGLGLLCGDLETLLGCATQEEVDTIPYLIGAIMSGFVPIVGDARDLIGSALNTDWVGFGLNILAVIPVVGDGARAVSKVVRAIAKLPTDKTDEALAIVRRVPGVSDEVADDVVEEVIGESLDVLRRSGRLTDAGIDELVSAGVDMKKLARIVEGASDVRHAPGTGFLDPKEAEVYLRETGFKQKGHTIFADPSNRRARKGSRIVDAWKEDGSLAREVKVGEQHLSDFVEEQIRKDVKFSNRDDFSVEWHFLPSEASGRICDDEDLFDALKEAGIPYVIHLP